MRKRLGRCFRVISSLTQNAERRPKLVVLACDLKLSELSRTFEAALFQRESAILAMFVGVKRYLNLRFFARTLIENLWEPVFSQHLACLHIMIRKGR